LAASRLLIGLSVALLALAATPGPAMATHNDDFGNASEITEDDLLAGYFDNNDNNGATPQSGEVLTCGSAPFNKTLWWTFTPPVNGVVDVTAAGIDSVIWIVPFDGQFLLYGDEDAECSDAPNVGVSENVFEYVYGEFQYYIQVGGYGTGTSAQEGNLDLTVEFFPDTDGDGVLDGSDDCPNTFGEQSLAGCPDSDGDGIRDNQDRCPNQRGEARYGGCADSDGDGKPDPDDACPSVRGDLANGCPSPPPRPDADGDGIFDDGPDRCLGENSRKRDENGNGCLDLATLSPKWIFDPGNYFVRRGGQIVHLGIAVQRFGVSSVPRGARVIVTCTRDACPRMRQRANSTVTFGRLQGKKLRAGVKITIRVTMKGYVGRARIYKIKKHAVTPKNRCLLPGRSKLLRDCSPVR
jgi:Thrombospondin type 3 repeat